VNSRASVNPLVGLLVFGLGCATPYQPTLYSAPPVYAPAARPDDSAQRAQPYANGPGEVPAGLPPPAVEGRSIPVDPFAVARSGPSLEVTPELCRAVGLLLLIDGQTLEARFPELGQFICRSGAATNCSGVSLGEGICRAGGSLNCIGVSLGEGVCRAGGSLNCIGVSLGEGICRAGGSLNCIGVSLGEGICRAGGSLNCIGVSLGEGVCRAGGSLNCIGVSLGEGICRAGGQAICSGVTVSEALCRIGGTVACVGQPLPAAICSAQGVSCQRVELDEALAAVIEACGVPRLFPHQAN
jgi:hypothetical protein